MPAGGDLRSHRPFAVFLRNAGSFLLARASGCRWDLIHDSRGSGGMRAWDHRRVDRASVGCGSARKSVEEERWWN